MRGLGGALSRPPNASACQVTVCASGGEAPQYQPGHEDVEQPREHDPKYQREQPYESHFGSWLVRAADSRPPPDPDIQQHERQCNDRVERSRCKPP
jgi:hypothetical protein